MRFQKSSPIVKFIEFHTVQVVMSMRKKIIITLITITFIHRHREVSIFIYIMNMYYENQELYANQIDSTLISLAFRVVLPEHLALTSMSLLISITEN